MTWFTATPQASLTSTRRRFVALDGLRGLAALLVIFYHVGWPTHLTGNKFVGNGYLAVDVFFLLSGIVIFHNYANDVVTFERFKRFLWLRFCRVYPLHFAVLVVLVCMEFAKLAVQGMGYSSEQLPFTNTTTYSALVANIFLVQGLHTLNELSWNLPSWSISCEFFAYVAFGFLTLTGVTRSVVFSVVAPVFSGAVYCALAVNFGNLDITYDWGGARCVAGFFLGSSIIFIGSFISGAVPDRVLQLAEVAVVVAAIALMSLATGSSVVLVIPLFIAAIALLQRDKGPIARLLRLRSIQYLGKISYSIYMVQLLTMLSVTIILKRFFKIPVLTDPRTQRITMIMNPWVGDIVLIGIILLVLLVATVTYEFIENPGRRLGRQLTAPGQNSRWGQLRLDIDKQ
ncbi:MAG: acyltransferase [Hyphomicrobiales bacterium]|nr:acyltransferase [Hyphomicrobiales bacterium]